MPDWHICNRSCTLHELLSVNGTEIAHSWRRPFWQTGQRLRPALRRPNGLDLFLPRDRRFQIGDSMRRVEFSKITNNILTLLLCFNVLGTYRGPTDRIQHMKKQ